MDQLKTIQKRKLPYVFSLLLIIVAACSLLIVINYFTIKILSANRAYVGGESHYSKGQKDAVRHLIMYLHTHEPEQWDLFKKELKVPQGDGKARVLLLQNAPKDSIKEGFRQGRNNEKDLENLIWLFKNFKSVSYLAHAIKEWEDADVLIRQLEILGYEVHMKVKMGHLTPAQQNLLLRRISFLSDRLTIKSRNFSDVLGEGCRNIKNYLTLTNIFFILIILGSVGAYYSAMVENLLLSKKETEAQNENLIVANRELDKFVYSASHDLRSPITSLKGLIEVAQLEDDPAQIKEYLNMMHESLSKQDKFIGDIIDYSKNKRKEVIIEQVPINHLIEESITQLEHMKAAKKIDFRKNLEIETIHSDTLRLKIILNNLLSNAIKYSDETKKQMFINIRTYNMNDFHAIEIEDNGIGIKEEFENKIFDMFFVTNNDNKGSGLGLYIIKEAVENIRGTITVNSKFGIGSIFTVIIPKRYER